MKRRRPRSPRAALDNPGGPTRTPSPPVADPVEELQTRTASSSSSVSSSDSSSSDSPNRRRKRLERQLRTKAKPKQSPRNERPTSPRLGANFIIIPSESLTDSRTKTVIKPDGYKDGPSSASFESKSRSTSREQLEFGPLMRSGKVEVLYRSPESDSITSIDRHLKEEQAKKVAPNQKQSPISIMSLNPTYVLNNKPLVIEYPATVENLRLNNTGFSWEVKLPYQISMTTSLHGAHLNTAYRYRLDQFHCHWGDSNDQGSEHSVDSRFYSAELHFVHYNMEKYHTFSKAARHSDGLAVLSVFVDAHEDHHNHAELEKIVSHLKQVQLKGEHSIIKQAVRLENLLPANRSYWSYQGSLTTPPYLESVTWFVLKHPIKCSQVQINKFRGIKSSLRHDDELFIKSNHRRTQPLNGRTIVMYDEPMAALAGPASSSPASVDGRHQRRTTMT